MGERWFVYACPYCGRQYRAPGSHSVAGDDRATGCFHAHEGEHGVTQPKLVRVEVTPPADFELQPIPHDRPPKASPRPTPPPHPEASS